MSGQHGLVTPDGVRRLSTIQVDLDGLWVLRKFIGADPVGDVDPVFESGLPRVLRLLQHHGVRATFFVNGVDLESSRRRRLVEQVLRGGHELANHGLRHRYLSRVSPAERVLEIGESTRRVRELTGEEPAGFRAAGYDLDDESLRLLQEHGYRYDSSACPTVVGPLLWASQYLTAGVSQMAFPPLRRLVGPRRPYRPRPDSLYRRGAGNIVEIPVSVLPVVRLPLSFTYAVLAGGWYLRPGLAWAVRAGGPVNFLFHLLDFADPVEDPSLSAIPGLRVPLERRLPLANWVVEFLKQRTEVLPTDELYRRLARPAAVSRV